MKRGKLIVSLCWWFVVVSPHVHAAPMFTISGGGSFTDSDNDFLWLTPRFGPQGNKVSIWKGGTLALSEAGLVTLEYIGKEAQFANNVFKWGALSGGTTIFSTGPSSPNPVGQTAATPFPPAAVDSSTFPGLTDAGTLPFSFFVNQTATNKANGSSDIGYWPLPEAAGGGGGSGLFGDVVYALLDDGKSDNDYDDMIVRLTVTEVPEPTALALAAAGMFPAAGWVLRRRRRKNSPTKPQGASPRDDVPAGAAAIHRAGALVLSGGRTLVK
jgi:hypothetical protein